MNYKIVWFLVFLLLCLFYSYTEVIDQPVARIKLIKTEVIYKSSFIKIVQSMEDKVNRPLIEKEKLALLDRLIEEKLIVQAAKQDNIVVAKSDVDNKIEELKQLLQLQEGRKYSDSEFKERIKDQGISESWEDFITQIENSVLQQKYIGEKKGKDIEDVKAPTKEEIELYYEENRTLFVSPEMIKFKQIFVLTKGVMPEKKKEYSKKVEEIYNELQKGGSFDNYSEIFIKGIDSKIGGVVIETWKRDDESRKVTYGKSFFNNLFRMEEGSLSEIQESNLGFHIIYIIKKYDFNILKLDDKIPPKNIDTVKDKIKEALKQKKQMDAYQTAYEEIIDDIKKKADIKIFKENLSW